MSMGSEALGIPRSCDGGVRLTGKTEGWSQACEERGKNRLQLRGGLDHVVYLCNWHMSHLTEATGFFPPSPSQN